jgi:hypothetical protein
VKQPFIEPCGYHLGHPTMTKLFRIVQVLTTIAAITFVPGGRSAAQVKAPVVRVLFIGNSYTYLNNLPALVEGLAGGLTPPRAIEAERVAVGGATLMSLWKQGKAPAAIRDGHFNYVVLQEHSRLGTSNVDGESVITDPERNFFPSVRLFDDAIKQAGGKTALMLTWAQKAHPEHQAALTRAYMTIGKERHALVIPAGLAWQRAAAERPTLSLYQQDGSHPAPAGSYLTALTVLAAIFDAEPRDPPLAASGRGIDIAGGDLSSTERLAVVDVETRSVLQRAAWGAWTSVRSAGGYVAGARRFMR